MRVRDYQLVFNESPQAMAGSRHCLCPLQDAARRHPCGIPKSWLGLFGSQPDIVAHILDAFDATRNGGGAIGDVAGLGKAA